MSPPLPFRQRSKIIYLALSKFIIEIVPTTIISEKLSQGTLFFYNYSIKGTGIVARDGQGVRDGAGGKGGGAQ